ncbi:MAG TPA: hypothetical protein VIW73_13420 [Candidatus Cybelea sp.]
MRASRFDQTLYVCAVAMLVAGCGSQAPIGVTTYADGAGSWMLPEAQNQDLLYVATGDNVYVLSYPHGKLVGSLNVAGNNLCSDKNGDVFVPTGGYVIFEYAHGGSNPFKTLHGGDIPLDCSVDPTTGNLAVTQESSGAGEVAIFPNAQDPPTWYYDPAIYMFGLCGYDDRGNLFTDGYSSANYLAELPKGSNTFTNYLLGNGFDVFGAIAWDGRNITLSNPTSHELDRLKFGKTSFKVVGTTEITGWQNHYSRRWPYIQTWLQGGTFIAQSSSLAMVGLWRYPGGGHARKMLRPFKSGNVNIYGVTVSVAPSR